MAVMDYGLSADKTLDLLVTSGWNDTCLPPWPVYGSGITLQQKCINAWKFRSKVIGLKSSNVFDDEYIEGAEDINETGAALTTVSDKSRFKGHYFEGTNLFKRDKRREMVIPGWLPANGMTALIAKRGVGKTVVMLDLALRLVSGMEWFNLPMKHEYQAVYLCGEDDEGAEEQIRAWCKHHDVEAGIDNFKFMDLITDLMDKDDTREYALFLKNEIGDDKAVVFLDTWQRASARGGQNKDEDMQYAIQHAEALARSLGGPVIAAFHPPKQDEHVILGSSIIENSTSAIWKLSDNMQVGKKLEVTRIKAKGLGNAHYLDFKEIELDDMDDFGQLRSGVVVEYIGGVSGKHTATVEYKERKIVLADIIKELEMRRKDNDPTAQFYTSSALGKRIVEWLVPLADTGDEWASGLIDRLRNVGIINFSRWQTIHEAIKAMFIDDPRPFDFGDGYVLRSFGDGSRKRLKIEKIGDLYEK